MLSYFLLPVTVLLPRTVRRAAHWKKSHLPCGGGPSARAHTKNCRPAKARYHMEGVATQKPAGGMCVILHAV